MAHDFCQGGRLHVVHNAKSSRNPITSTTIFLFQLETFDMVIHYCHIL